MKRSASMQSTPISPQAFLDALLERRGYSTASFCSLESGYYCKPTPLQKASYGIALVRAVRAGDATLLKKLLDCGLSPNPCNAFGESVVHMACRRGDHRLLNALLEAGCALQVSDDFGRTPLHDACWTARPSFETVRAILDVDVRLLRVVDCRGASPLSYVKRENWKEWIEFLDRVKERYWSPRDAKANGEERPPELAGCKPHSHPVKDPEGCVSLELAALIAGGAVDPDEFLKKRDEERRKGSLDGDASSKAGNGGDGGGGGGDDIAPRASGREFPVMISAA